MAPTTIYSALLIYFSGNILCNDDSYIQNRRLSVFDSPMLLGYNYVQEILLYERLREYRSTFKMNLQAIKSRINMVYDAKHGNGPYFEYNQRPDAEKFPKTLILYSMRAKVKRLFLDESRYASLRRRRIMVENIAFHVPDSPENVLRGGLLGLLVIQNTYNISIKFFLEGCITAHDIFQRKKSGQCKKSCTLDAIDVLALASHSLKLKWYTSTVLFANHAEHMYRMYPSEQVYAYPSSFQEVITIVRTHAHQRLSKDVKSHKNNMKFLPFSSELAIFRELW